MICYPDGTDAPTLSVANIQSTKVSSGGDSSIISRVVSKQLFNIKRTSLAYAGGGPSTGTWNKGDIVWNRLPDASEFIGFVCVTAGSPGTWKGFGQIEA